MIIFKPLKLIKSTIVFWRISNYCMIKYWVFISPNVCSESLYLLVLFVFVWLFVSLLRCIVLCRRLAPLAALALLSGDLLVAKCSGRGLYPDSTWALQRGCSGGVFHHLTPLLLVPHYGQQPGKSLHKLQILQKQHSTSTQSFLTWEDAVDWIWGWISSVENYDLLRCTILLTINDK